MLTYTHQRYTIFAWSTLTIVGCSIIEFVVHKFYPNIAKDQQRYIAKNMLKSVLLTFLAFYTTSPMWDFIVNGERNAEITNIIHTSGLMYLQKKILL